MREEQDVGLQSTTGQLVDPERRAILERLKDLLWLFGTANDADDHNCRPEGARLRRDASAGILELMNRHAFIADMLPGLGSALETGHIEGFGWSNLVDAVERLRASETME